MGNISHSVTDDELKKSFEEFGEVSSANVIKDKFTGESRGFGFVEMSNDEQGQGAIDSLDGTELKGRSLTVNIARPRKDFRGSGGGNYSRDRNSRPGGGPGGNRGRKRY